MTVLLIQLLLWISISLRAVAPQAETGDLTLTEAYFSASDPRERFLEFECTSETPVSLGGLTILVGTSPFPLTDSLTLEPGDRVVIAAESPLGVDKMIAVRGFALSKTRNSIVLLSSDGQVITRVELDSSLCDPRLQDCSSRSLVRVGPGTGPMSWVTSGGSPTPGIAGPNEWQARDTHHDETYLRLSEVLYQPNTGRGQLEFIEFVNTGAAPAMLHHLRIVVRSSSRSDTTRVGFLPDLLHSAEAAVAASPTRKSEAFLLAHDLAAAFPESSGHLNEVRVLPLLRSRTLPDLGFHLVLLAGAVAVDSAFIGPHLHHPALADPRGISVVRRSASARAQVASNWTSTTARDGATPAIYRALSTASLPGDEGLSIEPKLIPPGGATTIQINLKDEPSVLSVRIYDLQGRIRRTVSEAELAQETYAVFWDGAGDSGIRVPPGPYVVLVTVRGALSRRTLKSVVLVSGR